MVDGELFDIAVLALVTPALAVGTAGQSSLIANGKQAWRTWPHFFSEEHVEIKCCIGYQRWRPWRCDVCCWARPYLFDMVGPHCFQRRTPMTFSHSSSGIRTTQKPEAGMVRLSSTKIDRWNLHMAALRCNLSTDFDAFGAGTRTWTQSVASARVFPWRQRDIDNAMAQREHGQTCFHGD